MQKVDSREAFSQVASKGSEAQSVEPEVLKRGKEKKTAREWDRRTHEENSQGSGPKNP